MLPGSIPRKEFKMRSYIRKFVMVAALAAPLAALADCATKPAETDSKPAASPSQPDWNGINVPEYWRSL